MAKSPNWTSEELVILKDNYPTLGRSKEILTLLPGRSIEGICLKANRIGLRKIDDPRRGRSDTEYKELLKATTFTSLEPYNGSTEPIKHLCNTCGYTWLARPQQLLRKNAKCPICAQEGRLLSNEHVSEVLSNAGFKQLSEYTGSLDPILLEHLSCGYRWTTVFSYIQQGSGCPICNKGFGYTLNKDNHPEVAYIYLLKILLTGEAFLKIGVTTRTLSKRIVELNSSLKVYNPEIEVLYTTSSTGINTLLKERKILDKYTKHTTSIDFVGKTELLSLDNDISSIIKDMND